MDRYVVDPHWHDYIVWYFYLGGIAAGSFAAASLAALFGSEADRRGTRAADYLALPLIAACGLLLVVDLGRPERFWHMLIQSETFRPMFKWWSPMSAGSWGLSAFGFFAGIGFVGTLIEDGWLGSAGLRDRTARLRRGGWGKLLALGGATSAFFLGSYTGVLLAATNQPVWSDSTWLAALFLVSAASTGVAATLVVTRWRLADVGQDVLDRLERLDAWAIGLEILMLAMFLVSLGGLARPALTSWPGILVPMVVVPAGLAAPLVLRVARRPWAPWASSALVLAAGFALRAAVVGMPGIFRVGG